MYLCQWCKHWKGFVAYCMLRVTVQGSSTPQLFRFLVLCFRLRSFHLCPITEANVTGTAQNEISTTHQLNHSPPNPVLIFLFHQYSMNLWQWRQAPCSRSNASPSKVGPQQQHCLQLNRQGTRRWTGLCRSVNQSQRCKWCKIWSPKRTLLLSKPVIKGQVPLITACINAHMFSAE